MQTTIGFIEPETIKSVLRLAHFFGLVLGLGTATFLDLMIVRFMVRGRIKDTQLSIFTFGSHAVTVGLLIIWASGVGFLWWYTQFDPEPLGNPKIWAKIAIVWVLTVNAAYLHLLVLPIFNRQTGKRLFSALTGKQRTMLVVGGVTSALSWYFPLAIAAQSWLNFRVPMGPILLIYFMTLVGAVVLGLVATTLIGWGMAWWSRRQSRVAVSEPTPQLLLLPA